jgi:hypothetical protein
LPHTGSRSTCCVQLVDLFKRIDAADREAANFNNRSPAGHFVRGVEASIGKGEKIIDRVRLPVMTENGVQDMWPPKNNWAVEYFETVRAGIVNAKPPPDEIERAEAARRHIAAGEADEREHQRLNAEAAARAAAHAAEQRRLVAGEV